MAQGQQGDRPRSAERKPGTQNDDMAVLVRLQQWSRAVRGGAAAGSPRAGGGTLRWPWLGEEGSCLGRAGERKSRAEGAWRELWGAGCAEGPRERPLGGPGPAVEVPAPELGLAWKAMEPAKVVEQSRAWGAVRPRRAGGGGRSPRQHPAGVGSHALSHVAPAVSWAAVNRSKRVSWNRSLSEAS